MRRFSILVVALVAFLFAADASAAPVRRAVKGAAVVIARTVKVGAKLTGKAAKVATAPVRLIRRA